MIKIYIIYHIVKLKCLCFNLLVSYHFFLPVFKQKSEAASQVLIPVDVDILKYCQYTVFTCLFTKSKYAKSDGCGGEEWITFVDLCMLYVHVLLM